MKIGLAACGALGALLISAAAPAQIPAKKTSPAKDYVEQKVDGGTVVTFPGEDLFGDANDPYMGLVRRPPQVLRAGLIQPRMNFVPELLKSVENL